MKRFGKLAPLAPIGVLIVLGLTFWGGMLTQKHFGKTSATASANTNGTSPSGFGSGTGWSGNFAGRRGTIGTVATISGTAMTVTTMSGSTVTVSLANNPTVTDSSGNASTDSAIAVGDTVLVTGATGSDGTVRATRVRLNPSFGGGAPSAGTRSSSSDGTQSD